jgi:spoIIIJ-associated protein
MEESLQFAKKYLEDMLSFFGLNVDVYATSEDGEVIELNVPSTHLNGFLIGNRGDTMRSLQYVINMALKSREFEVTRVNVDIADYKKQRASRLEERAEEWLKEVKDTGKERHLPVMNAADRRTIHRLAGENGLATESVGEGRDRHIVLMPADGVMTAADPDDPVDEAPSDDTPTEEV